MEVGEIVNVESLRYVAVKTEHGEYRRFDSDDWEKLWGMTWERVQDCVDIEAQYQAHITTPSSWDKIAADVLNRAFENYPRYREIWE